MKIWAKSKMQIENELLKRKKELLLKMLFNREIAFFWNFIEKDSIRSEVFSFMKIRIVSHEVWQIFEFHVFQALMKIITEIIKNRFKNDVLKFCYEFYRNSWFLIKKKEKKKYSLINVVLKMNRVIIRNANLFFTIDEFWRNLQTVQSSRLWICSLNTINYRQLRNVTIWSSSWRRLIWWEWQRFSWKRSILWFNSFEWSIKLSLIVFFITRCRS
jgi:hypothetical protein